MADIKLPKSIPCGFDLGWAGKCGKPTDNGICTEHENVTCVCCQKKATHTCDHAVSLVCGAYLCDDCTHKPGGNMGEHITKEAATKIFATEEAERKAKDLSRNNPEPRIDEVLGIPVNLFELLKTDCKSLGFNLTKAYFLELEHGLAGFFPAVLEEGDTDDMIVVTEISVLESVWRIIEPRKAQLVECTVYFNPEKGYCYGDAQHRFEQELRKPFKVLTQDYFDALEKNEDTVRWAYGLLSFSLEPTKEEFWGSLVKQAQKFDPSFQSKFS